MKIIKSISMVVLSIPPFQMSSSSTSDHPESTLPGSGIRGIENYEHQVTESKRLQRTSTR